jgi:hypothetical protein
MFHVLIDTSVWLDLAENPKQTPLLEPLDAMTTSPNFGDHRDVSARPA